MQMPNALAPECVEPVECCKKGIKIAGANGHGGVAHVYWMTLHTGLLACLCESHAVSHNSHVGACDDVIWTLAIAPQSYRLAIAGHSKVVDAISEL